MDQKLTFHYDAGHAWLEVNTSELARLGIADQISGYSYKRGGKAYLEEDWDAGLFIEALTKTDGVFISQGDIREADDGDYSPIRGYDRYR